MDEYRLKKAFNIDHGELDGMSPQECFCLGYELGQIDRLLVTKYERDGFTRIVHSANRERIAKSCDDAGIPFRMTYMDGDVSESWMTLQTGNEIPSDG